MKQIMVIGGGLVGLATALKLGRRFPEARVCLIEKESTVGRHQSTHNSGVLHSGLYYQPGSIKARMAVSGIREMVTFCQENSIAHEICGKLVVATNEVERERLNQLLDRGTKNGLQGLKLLGREEMLEIEPHVAGIAAIRVPQEGIVDYQQVCNVMVRKIEGSGGKVLLGTKVMGLREHSAGWAVQTTKGDFEADYIVNCTGLHCDRVAALAGEKREVRVVPFRGEYFKLRTGRQHLVRHLIYPVPDPAFPFLGVHFTRLIEGGVEAGPNAVLAFSREGYRKTDVNLADLMDAVSYRGLWRFLNKHKRMCWEEVRRSLSKELFCQALQRLVPEIQVGDLEVGGAGVRAQALAPEGELVHDFCLVQKPRALHVLNAPSPAATASLAIGGEIAARVGGEFEG